MSPFRHATPAQKAYIKSLGATGLNPYLGRDEAKLIATNLAWNRAGRALGEPCTQGPIKMGRV